MHETDESPTDLPNCHDTAADKMLKHEHIKENSTGSDPPTRFSNDPASQVLKERFILGLTVSLKETSEATGKNRAENIARLDSNIKENAPTKKRRYKLVVRKILSSRFENQTKKSNEDELAPTFVQCEKNDGNGSNMHDTEKAKSGSHTKDDSNVNLDNTKTVPGLFSSSHEGYNSFDSYNNLRWHKMVGDIASRKSRRAKSTPGLIKQSASTGVRFSEQLVAEKSNNDSVFSIDPRKLLDRLTQFGLTW